MIFKCSLANTCINLFFSFLWLYSVASEAAPTHSYPRVMGVNIGAPAFYDDASYQEMMSKTDVLIMGFWPKWKEYRYGRKGMLNVVKKIKSLNPNIIIGQYTILNETQSIQYKDKTKIDLAKKVDKENWWLLDAIGNKVQWTSKYGAFDINSTEWTHADKNGLRYPEWLALRNYKVFFQKVPEFDFWFLDNSLSVSPVKVADWNQNGIPDFAIEKSIAKAYRQGNVNYWKAILKLQPKTLLIGNSDDLSSADYKGQLNGALLEALIGRTWSLEKKKGWFAVMQRYFSFFENLALPKIVGFNVWGDPTDYQLMRYGLVSCLLNEGYFSFTDKDKGYKSVPWFDEYDVDLGIPLTPPKLSKWRDGIYRRDFQKGMVLLNPSNSAKTVNIESGFRRFLGQQDSKVNNGMRVSGELTLKAKDGIILVRTELLN